MRSPEMRDKENLLNSMKSFFLLVLKGLLWHGPREEEEEIVENLLRGRGLGSS